MAKTHDGLRPLDLIDDDESDDDDDDDDESNDDDDVADDDEVENDSWTVLIALLRDATAKAELHVKARRKQFADDDHVLGSAPVCCEANDAVHRFLGVAPVESVVDQAKSASPKNDASPAPEKKKSRRKKDKSAESKKSDNSGDEDAEEGNGNKNECVVCLDAKPNCTGPCGHVAVCVECSADLETCPICRNKVDKWIRLFNV